MDKSKINAAACDLVIAVENDLEAMQHFHKGEVLFSIPFKAKDGTILQVLCGSESVIKGMWEANTKRLVEERL